MATKDNSNFDLLTQQLGDLQSSWQSRQTAAHELGKAKNSAAIPALLNRVQDAEEHIRVRCMAVAGLREMRATEAIPMLRELIQNPATDLELLGFSIAAIGVLGDESSLLTIMTFAQHTDPSVRRLAAFALRKLHAGQAVPLLMELAADQIGYVRREAIDGLGEIGDNEALDVLISELDDPVEMVRAAAARALGAIADERARGPLLAKLNDEENVALAAVYALGIVGDLQTIPALEWVRDNRTTYWNEPDLFQRFASKTIAHIEKRHMPN